MVIYVFQIEKPHNFGQKNKGFGHSGLEKKEDKVQNSVYFHLTLEHFAEKIEIFRKSNIFLRGRNI